MKPRWIGTVLYVPVLYGLGWLLARPLAVMAPSLRPDQLDLAGAAISLVLLMLSLPWRLRRAWGKREPWRQLGVAAPGAAVARAFLRGLLKALLLLALVVAVLLAFGQARWSGAISGGAVANALALLLGVGFAEELLFRGWLWGELDLQMVAPKALITQALVFSLVHTRFNVGLAPMLALLGGLLLLGLVLALQRSADEGVLWGAVGLHGGLVGGWFALQAGLIEVSATAPAWLAGPGAPHPNPIGSVSGWLGLGLLLLVRRRYWGEGINGG